MQPFKFFQRNPHKDRSRLEIGSSFVFRGYYCTVTRMGFNHFNYVIQENGRECMMHYDYYLTTPSAAGRQLNRR